MRKLKRRDPLDKRPPGNSLLMRWARAKGLPKGSRPRVKVAASIKRNRARNSYGREAMRAGHNVLKGF